MNRKELISRCYQEFSEFQKPDRATTYSDSLVDQDHEKSLENIKRHNLSIDIIGPSTWSPISYLNEEGLAYYMPRLIELAVLNVNDVDGEPFINRFVNDFFLGPQNEVRFKLLGQNHQRLMQEAFKYIKNTFADILEVEGWKEEVDLAIKNWSPL